VNIPSAPRVPVIGLVGGIGSGKSAVAKGLANRRRIKVINADEIGHRVLKDPHVKQKIADRFGERVVDSLGEVDRSKLARLVFGSNSQAERARRDLNKIVHPEIGRQIQKEIDSAQNLAQEDPGSIEGVVLDAAILLETGWGEKCDAIVFVDADESVREQRVSQNRGWTKDERKKREQNQLDLDAKRKASDQIIHNSGELDLAVDAFERFFASQILKNPSS